MTWSDAPTAVTRALGLIQQRMKEASLDETVTFNEVLTAAYMEKQKMAVSLVDDFYVYGSYIIVI